MCMFALQVRLLEVISVQVLVHVCLLQVGDTGVCMFALSLVSV